MFGYSTYVDMWKVKWVVNNVQYIKYDNSMSLEITSCYILVLVRDTHDNCHFFGYPPILKPLEMAHNLMINIHYHSGSYFFGNFPITCFTWDLM